MEKLIPWTLFIDMLGYGDINGNINNEENAQDFYKFMRSNADVFDLQDSKEIREIYKKK